ncbi:MAG TPA: PQQ-binding-like beta-propeller repeat protein [Tepidisphaeraceae bacterium]
MTPLLRVIPLLLVVGFVSFPVRGDGGDNTLFARDNLVAWCIVPFDAKKRGPEERAAMLERMGIHHFAYDWRAEHLPTFDAEIDALAKHHIELTAVWFPPTLDADARRILDVLKKRGLKPQLWVIAAGSPLKDEKDQDKLIEAAANAVRPVAQEAAKIGCTVGLYNHGGWFGEPENQLAVLAKLNLPNVGMVYNLHHAHDQMGRFKTVLDQIKPHLLCLNLNGMTRNGDQVGKKILPIGQGEQDLELLRIIRDSGYRGPIGVLNHTDEDAEGRLLDNIEGLEWLVPQLDGKPAGTPPKLRTYTPAVPIKADLGAKPQDYWAVEDPKAREALPLYQTIPAATPEELTTPNGWPDAGEYSDWYRSHAGDACTRYSPLDQINKGNVKSLKMAWTYRSGDGKGNIQCNPVIVAGVMYVPTVGNNVVAVNAKTGEEIWRFAPGTGRPAHRGLTFYKGDAGVSARVLFAAGNALWALDPKNGKPIDSFGEGGKLKIIDCVAAPAVYKSVLVYAGWNRDVFGVDLLSGRPLWTFHTVPQKGEPFADTWDRPQEGANCWGGMALDASRGIVYATLGSPKPNFIGVGHHGDNLFGNCVLALDAMTGRYLWHFQEIRHDIWDLDIPAPPMLVTVNHDGRRVDAVAAVTKIGNTLLLDRVSGKPLFPFRLRRAPTSKLPGEQTSAYQPDVELPQPFARQEFRLEDVSDLSPEAHEFVMDKLEEVGAVYGRFLPFEEAKPLAMYGFHGGAEWTGACFDPATGLLYVSSNEIPWLPSVHRYERPQVDETKLPPTPGRTVYEKNCMPCHGPNREGLAVNPSLLGVSQRLKDADVLALLKTGKGIMPAAPQLTDADKKVLLDYLFDRDRPNLKPAARPERPGYRDGGYPKLLDNQNYPGTKPPWGLLNAIDLNTGKIAWRVPLGEDEALTKKGIPRTGTENFGGPLVTAGGLVFCAGTRDLKIRAFDKATGEELWSARLPHGGFAPPATYEVDGKQYIVIPATGGGKLAVQPHPGPAQPWGDACVAFTLP